MYASAFVVYSLEQLNYLDTWTLRLSLQTQAIHEPLLNVKGFYQDPVFNPRRRKGRLNQVSTARRLHVPIEYIVWP